MPTATKTRVSLEDQYAAVIREIAMRRNVYRRRVAIASMTQADADRELAAMEAVAATVKRWIKVRRKLHVSSEGSLHIALNGVQLSGPTGVAISDGDGVDRAIDESPLWER